MISSLNQDEYVVAIQSIQRMKIVKLPLPAYLNNLSGEEYKALDMARENKDKGTIGRSFKLL